MCCSPSLRGITERCQGRGSLSQPAMFPTDLQQNELQLLCFCHGSRLYYVALLMLQEPVIGVLRRALNINDPSLITGNPQLL